MNITCKKNVFFYSARTFHITHTLLYMGNSGSDATGGQTEETSQPHTSVTSTPDLNVVQTDSGGFYNANLLGHQVTNVSAAGTTSPQDEYNAFLKGTVTVNSLQQFLTERNVTIPANMKDLTKDNLIRLAEKMWVAGGINNQETLPKFTDVGNPEKKIKWGAKSFVAQGEGNNRSMTQKPGASIGSNTLKRQASSDGGTSTSGSDGYHTGSGGWVDTSLSDPNNPKVERQSLTEDNINLDKTFQDVVNNYLKVNGGNIADIQESKFYKNIIRNTKITIAILKQFLTDKNVVLPVSQSAHTKPALLDLAITWANSEIKKCDTNVPAPVKRAKTVSWKEPFRLCTGCGGLRSV